MFLSSLFLHSCYGIFKSLHGVVVSGESSIMWPKLKGFSTISNTFIVSFMSPKVEIRDHSVIILSNTSKTKYIFMSMSALMNFAVIFKMIYVSVNSYNEKCSSGILVCTAFDFGEDKMSLSLSLSFKVRVTLLLCRHIMYMGVFCSWCESVHV